MTPTSRALWFPEMLNSYLGVSGKLDYDAQVVVNQVPFTPLYDSEPRPPRSKIWTPDASVALLEIAPPRSSLGPRVIGKRALCPVPTAISRARIRIVALARAPSCRIA